jgi:hypothetical protein
MSMGTPHSKKLWQYSRTISYKANRDCLLLTLCFDSHRDCLLEVVRNEIEVSLADSTFQPRAININYETGAFIHSDR